jgi:hypothetical protein
MKQIHPNYGNCKVCGSSEGERCRTMSDDNCDAGKHVVAHSPQRANQAWTTEEDDRLRDAFNLEIDLEDIVIAHQRSVSSVISRMIHLGLLINRGECYYKIAQDPYSSYGEAKAMKERIYGK